MIQFIRDQSPFLQKERNNWMKSVMNIVRNTALYFEPQIRTKILHEGWASYWHDTLFKKDSRIKGHEVSYARINAYVTSISRVGLNPYAIGLRLMEHIEDLGNKGKMTYEFQKIKDIQDREDFDVQANKGRQAIFDIRSHFNDFSMINTFVDQDFVDNYNLFVTGKRLNQERRVWEYYVKSRKAEDYKQMMIDSLYHPPKILVNTDKTCDEFIYLEHVFEGKSLYKDFIPETLQGIAYLWGGEAKLETTEVLQKAPASKEKKPERIFKRVLYEVKNKHVTRREIA